VKVEIEDFAFSPASLTIAPGTQVTFVNKDSVKHSATGDGDAFDTGLLGKDEKAVITFDKEGTFTYFCGPHPDMKATIVVQAK
jgi:plastocyanin